MALPEKIRRPTKEMYTSAPAGVNRRLRRPKDLGTMFVFIMSFSSFEVRRSHTGQRAVLLFEGLCPFNHPCDFGVRIPSKNFGRFAFTKAKQVGRVSPCALFKGNWTVCGAHGVTCPIY